MADVIVTLSLKRKSGILAAAVSSLARSGLEFKSHRFVDEDADDLCVELMAEGEVADSDALAEVLERIRGVDSVADIDVDGRSLLHDSQPEAPAGEEAAPESVNGQEPPAASVETIETVEETPPAEPEPEAFSDVTEVAGADDPDENPQAGDADSDSDKGDPSSSGRKDDSGKNPMRRSMMRRRRRFT